ncbi:preprotein translocase subunit SecA [candidate division WOR-3 bacterium]|nr:preprotein translocase subunit SecA [candidate division WOR-3 bacterium]
MLDKLLGSIFGTKNDRELKRLRARVDEINSVFEQLKGITAADLPRKTEELVKRVADGEPLDDLVPEAFALVKWSCKFLVGKEWPAADQMQRWQMVPFDVQLIGGMVLHEGKIAEMRTGEGKTLVATMPLYLNALAKKGAQLITVNDYLARRDREWMGPVYEQLGLTLGCIQQGMGPEERQPQYAADVTYGTNNEFGFDYLRDNMVGRMEDKVQRGHHYAIVDEVDSILIDEARTPLIISGPVESEDKGYDQLTPMVKRLFSHQTVLVNRIVEEAERMLADGKEQDAAVKLLQARRGAPKNKRLMKVERGEGIKRMVDSAEGAFRRDKTLHEVDEDLYFVIDEQSHSIGLTDKGRELLAPGKPESFVLPELSEELGAIDRDERLSPKEKIHEREQAYQRYARKSDMLHSLQALLKAFSLFEKDVDYVVQDGRVIIVDEFTGRLMPGRRFSDGLHGALESKEGVTVQGETQTFATITLQNYFRMYEKLAGMTGTAITSAAEFFGTYKLDVVTIPTNEPVRRIDYPDLIYRTRNDKYDAVITEIEEQHATGRPILVGTTSVDVSEVISRMLRRKGINHKVLNAKHHQQEAEVVTNAGQPGAVTIATNMAGRGTDIKLGDGVVKGEECYLVSGGGKCAHWEEQPGRCNEEVPCGLYILGTERHEARRIDDQLRGRSGRQGDPGSSRFYLSLEDDLMRLFGSERVASIMDRWGGDDKEPIEHGLVTRAIANAQRRVEVRNAEIRRHLLEYDDVMNKQREVVYTLRDRVLAEQDPRPVYDEAAQGLTDSMVRQATAGRRPDEWDWDGLAGEFQLTFLADPGLDELNHRGLDQATLARHLTEVASRRYDERLEELGEELMGHLCRHVFLRTIDAKWRDHLHALDSVREGIGLRAYGQKDPLVEYKQESFRLFEEMMGEFQKESLALLFRAQVRTADEQRKPVRRQPVHAFKPAADGAGGGAEQPQPAQARRTEEKVGRNDPCPCGSGKKYKKCCGRKTD